MNTFLRFTSYYVMATVIISCGVSTKFAPSGVVSGSVVELDEVPEEQAETTKSSRNGAKAPKDSKRYDSNYYRVRGPHTGSKKDLVVGYFCHAYGCSGMGFISELAARPKFPVVNPDFNVNAPSECPSGHVVTKVYAVSTDTVAFVCTPLLTGFHLMDFQDAGPSPSPNFMGKSCPRNYVLTGTKCAIIRK